MLGLVVDQSIVRTDEGKGKNESASKSNAPPLQRPHHHIPPSAPGVGGGDAVSGRGGCRADVRRGLCGLNSGCRGPALAPAPALALARPICRAMPLVEVPSMPSLARGV